MSGPMGANVCGIMTLEMFVNVFKSFALSIE